MISQQQQRITSFYTLTFHPPPSDPDQQQLIAFGLLYIFHMATVVPPPSKRQRLEISEKARQQQEVQTIPDGLGSIRVQFFDQATGKATGPAVAVPVADSSTKNLETLLNTLQENVGMLASSYL